MGERALGSCQDLVQPGDTRNAGCPSGLAICQGPETVRLKNHGCCLCPMALRVTLFVGKDK